jgi:hypothetical protein
LMTQLCFCEGPREAARSLTRASAAATHAAVTRTMCPRGGGACPRGEGSGVQDRGEDRSRSPSQSLAGPVLLGPILLGPILLGTRRAGAWATGTAAVPRVYRVSTFGPILLDRGTLVNFPSAATGPRKALVRFLGCGYLKTSAGSFLGGAYRRIAAATSSSPWRGSGPRVRVRLFDRGR